MLAGFAAVLAALFPLAQTVREDITRDYLWWQDRPLLLAMGAVWAVALLAGLRRHAQVWRLPPWSVAALAAVLFIACWAGHYGVLDGYSVSRDEQMVDFDAAIYARGALAWPVPQAWRADLPALNTVFTLPVDRPIAWVSSYLPLNAGFHALLGAAAGPLWVAVALLALWGAARRLFGAQSEGVAVAVVLLALSGQVLIAGMSNFAMPAHLALNCVWLWLFLADRRRADGAALGIGFIATGLHQPLFHPLFAAPWIALLLWERRWRRAGLFIAAYAAMSLFWLWWPHVTRALVMGPDSRIVDVGAGYLSRLLDVLAQDVQNAPLMAANLLRLVAWTHPALWVLVALGLFGGAGAVWHDRRAMALMAGLVAPVVFMGLILPWQGHGFGYRYLHPVLGNAALLGAYGWLRLGVWRDRLRGPLVLLSLGAALVLVPMQGWLAHRLYGAFAQVSARIDASGADYMLISAMDGPLVLDLAYNRPDLSNRPLRLSLEDMPDESRLAKRICAHGETVALPLRTLYVPIARVWHLMPGRMADRRLPLQRALFESAGCKVVVLD